MQTPHWDVGSGWGLQGEPHPQGTGDSQPPWGLFPGVLTPPVDPPM